MTKELLPTPDDAALSFRSSLTDSAVYLSGTTDGTVISFYRLDVSDRKIRKLGVTYDQPIEGFSALEDGTLCLLGVNEDGQYRISRLSPEGAQREILLDPKATEGEALYGFEAFGEGYLILTAREALALDAEGRIVKSYGEYSHGAQLVRLSEKHALVIYGGSFHASTPDEIDRPTQLLYLDENFDEHSRTELTGDYRSFFGGVGESLFVTLAGTVYAYDYFSGDLQEQFNLDTSTNFVPDYYLGDGCFFIVERRQPVLWRAVYNEETVTLTLASYNPNQALVTAIQQFNESNCGYSVVIEDYAKYDEYDNQSQGLSRYATEIITGNTPDIYDLAAFSAEQYAAKGLIADLTPYFERDSELSLSDLFPALREQTAFRGGVYALVPAWYILALFGPPSTLPGRPTAEEFLALAEEIDPTQLLGPEVTRAKFLEYLLCFMGDELYSTETASCNFTSDAFVSLLRFAASLPEYEFSDGEMPESRAYYGRQLMYVEFLRRGLANTIAFANTIFGGEARFTGLPTGRGCGPALVPDIQLGMAADSDAKEGVWVFFRFLLSDGVQSSLFSFWDLPAKNAILEQKIDSWLEEYFQQPHTLVSGNAKIEGTLDEAAAKNQINAILNGIDTNADYDRAIYDMIWDSCGPLFAGDKTPEETAALIQSRVSIYLSEQYG